jgi:hypothetical protein
MRGVPRLVLSVQHVLGNPVKYQDPTGHRACASGIEVCAPKPKPTTLPNAKYYLVAGSYFDKSHINGGKKTGGEIYAQVRSAIASGGGSFTINRPLGRHGIYPVSYHANYSVTGNATEDQATGIALAIYMDFEFGYELFQGEMSFGIYGSLQESAFAIEDFPSDYVGFYAAVHEDFETSQVLRTIGPVEAADGTPPRSTCLQPACDRHDLKNVDFAGMTRKVESNGRWVNVPWPEELQITPLNDSNLWLYGGEQYCLGRSC